MIKLGSHVGMKGKEMFLGSAKEAHSYGANAFMIFTGAPQNTKRKEISELRADEGLLYMKEHGINDVIVHAPYIINLGNTVKEDTFRLAVEFLAMDIERCAALGSKVLVLHPGAHVGAGSEAGIAQIAKGLNEILRRDTPCTIALETMAGKGSEIGYRLEELAAIYDLVHYNDKLRICLDTCHLHDSGYDVVNDFDGVVSTLDRLLGIDQAAVLHINDSKNPCGAKKDRHANIGEGAIGFHALRSIVHHPAFLEVPKILETPYRPRSAEDDTLVPPYEEEIAWLLAPL